MKFLIVGNDDCSFNEIVTTMEYLPTSSKVLVEWTKLARNLETPILEVKMLENCLLLEKKDIWEVVSDLLVSWRSRCANNATLSALLHIIEQRCGWHDVADALWKKFTTKIVETTVWTDLDERTQAKIMDSKIDLLGTEKTFKQILDTFEDIQKQEILNETLNGTLILQLLQNDVTLLTRDTIPKLPAYYIPRTLSSRRRIHHSIFEENCSDIFVVDNIEFYQFYEISGGKRLERSSQQLKKLTARFILLEFAEDFDEICQKAGRTSVHLLKYIESKLYWIKTQGNLRLIQENLHSDQNLIPEMDFFEGFQNNQDMSPICIADSPGMGKSVLLASLCRLRKSQKWDKLISYVNFEEFISNVNLAETEIAFPSILAKHLSRNILGCKLLTYIFQNLENELEIFLDGFDEVPLAKLQFATNILRGFQSAQKKAAIRIFVATRLHRREQLEQTLSVLSFNILPFQESDQSHCLQQYWFHICGIPVNPNLERFATILVSQIRSTVSSNECDVAGIPLQCAMLAEIYELDAKKHANADSLKFGVVFTANSVCDMYRILMQQRFQKIKEEQQHVLRRFHQMIALDVLFPEFATKIKSFLLPESVVKEIDFEAVNKAGILVAAETDIGEDNQKRFRFGHRTYAEFLLSELLVEYLNTFNSSTQKENELDLFILTFLFLEVIQVIESDGNFRVNTSECPISSVRNEMQTNPIAEDCRKDWTNIATGLNMSHDDITEMNASLKYNSGRDVVEYESDILWLLLWQWTKEEVTTPRLNELVDVLYNLNLNQMADALKSRFYKKYLLNSNLCFFLDSSLSDLDLSQISFQNVFSGKNPNSMNKILEKISHLLEGIISHNFSNMLQLVVNFCLSAKETFSFKLDADAMRRQILRATNESTGEILKICCEFLECVEDIPLYQVKFGKKLYELWECTPMHLACRRGDISIFLYLLSKFEPVICQMNGLLHMTTEFSLDSPEHVFAEKLQIMTALLKRNPDFLEEMEPDMNRTPILMHKVHYKVYKYLIASGANPYAVDKDGNSLAHFAAWYFSSNHFTKLTKFLLKKKLEQVFLIHNTKFKLNPLHVALAMGAVEIDTLNLLAGQLKEKLNLNNPDFEGDTELFAAVSDLLGIPILKAIVKLGGDPKRLRMEKQTIVHVAAHYGNVEAIKYFVTELGCNINARDVHKRTPLHLVFTVGKRNVDETVQVLVELKADVAALDDKGRSPIWYAESEDDGWKLKPSTLDLLRNAPEIGAVQRLFNKLL